MSLPRRLLHLLLSPGAAAAIDIAVEQRRRGDAPVLVLGPGATGLVPPTEIESVRLTGQRGTGTIGYRELLELIDEASSVIVW